MGLKVPQYPIIAGECIPHTALLGPRVPDPALPDLVAVMSDRDFVEGRISTGWQVRTFSSGLIVQALESGRRINPAIS